MKAFFPTGTKFSAHGHTWVAGPQRHVNSDNAFSDQVQHWQSEKTWLTISCHYEVRPQILKWQVTRYQTAKSRMDAAKIAAHETEKELMKYRQKLLLYGDQYDKRYARKALQRLGIEEETNGKTT